MKKLFSNVMALLMVALIAAPAAMAERSKAPLSLTQEVDIRQQEPGVPMPMTKKNSFKKNSNLKSSVTAENLRSVMNRKNAKKFAPSFAATQPTFNAVLVYEDGYYNYPVSNVQMTQFSSQPPFSSETLSMWNLTYGASYGAVMGKDYYYVWDATVNSQGYSFYESGKVYDPSTWELVDEVPYSSNTAFLIAASYDPTTGNIYAFGYNETGDDFQFGIFDPLTFTTSRIASASIYPRAISCSGEGKIYAIDMEGNFGTINKSNGRFTLIKSTGLSSRYATSGAIDPLDATPVFYYATCNDDGSDLFAIDCATGDCSHVYVFNNGQELTGMYFDIPKSETDLNAPGKATVNSIEFEGTSLSGTVSFTAPSKLAGGTTAPTGEVLSYEIVANGQVLRSGANIEYGHTYKVPVAVEAAGLYKFTVTVYNEVAPSPKSNFISKWVGPDVPSAVTNVNASWADGKMTVAWDPTTIGANGGAIENVTYAVYNAADDTLIKDAITETSCTFDVNEPTLYTEFQYYVVAISNGEASEMALSNKVALGNFMAPFSTPINSSTTPDWAIFDVNGDGKSWSMSYDCARYTYNSRSDADDWLISNGIAVQRGQLYTITVSARSQSSTYVEKLEVKLGTSATPDAMTTEVIGETVINNTTYAPYTGTFTATSDVIYIGLHAVSDKDKFYLSVNELSIDGGVNANAPSSASDLNVVVPYSGDNKATLSYISPNATIDGSDLTGERALTSVEVLVNDKVEYVDNQPKPGAMSSIEINVPTFGVYKFQVVGYNKYGEGESAEISAYVGINVPAAVTNAKITEISDGVVNVTWDAVTTDVDGNLINPALVKYAMALPVYNESGNIVDFDILVDNLTETSVNDYAAVPEGQQDFVQYIILSMTEAGMRGAWTNSVPVGTPYSLPYTDTFEGGRLDHILGFDASGDSWGITDDWYSITSRNKDNGYLACYGQVMMNQYYYGKYFGCIYTGKIALAMQHPELSFYYFGINPTCQNTITTQVVCDGNITDVDVAVCDGNYEWKHRTVDLSAFAGKTVQVRFYVKMVSSTIGLQVIGCLDDIRIGEHIAVDVVADQISAPATVKTENEFNIGYRVYNQGTEEAKNVFVSLYANGNLVESSVDTLTVGAGQTINGTFDQAAFSLFESGTYQFSYVVDCEADMDLTNNISDVVKVTVYNTNLPTPELAGSEVIEKADSTATINLSWEAPTIDLTYGVEGFESESYPAWTTSSFAGWTLLNFNDSPTYGNVADVPFPNMSTPFGWILFDSAELGINEPGHPFAAYEGSCCMAAFSHSSGANDAWLISPAQSGSAQTVTFMARNTGYTSRNAETMRCYYSTTGTNVEDFNMLVIQGYSLVEGVPYEWTEYTLNLPAGTKYFAIRSTAKDTYCLLVDNITYMGGTSPFESLEIQGYDVYRNQVKLNNNPITAEEYTDVVKENGSYAYSVVAIYNEGKSAPSNIYTVDVDFTQDGIADAVAGVNVTVDGNFIAVTGAEAVAIASVDGKLVYAGKSARVAVAPGIYVVKADDTVTKVIVK